MNPTRRSLCGLGVAGVPLALLGQRFFSAAPGPAEQVDPLLAHLIDDARRNCRLASRPGRGRANGVRNLGANLAMLDAYMHSRREVAGIRQAIGQRVRDEGIDAIASQVRDAWPARAASISRDFAVSLPAELDYQTVTAAIGRLQRHGCPRFRGMRRWFDREADRIEQQEGRTGVVTPVRQTPGNDYGPPGWNAGIGDPGAFSCHDLKLLLGVVGALAIVEPELAPLCGSIAGIVGLAIALFCEAAAA